MIPTMARRSPVVGSRCRIALALVSSPESDPLVVEGPLPAGQYADVALPLPLPVSYRYLIPETLADRVLAGARVVVPLRGRELVGIVTAVADEAPDAAARPILA